MAVMIPDRLPSEASAGEKRVFAALQRLDDDCLVYYEPLVRQRYPDFVVIIPDTGVLIIEVKGWYPAEILRGDQQDVRVKSRDGIESVQAHPVRQGREYMHRLRDECREHPLSADLLNSGAQREGAFIFPFGHIAVLSNITREQLDDPARPLAPIFSQRNVITRDELMAWTELDAKALRAGLVKRFDPYWPIPKMTQEQIDVLRSVIHPEVKLSASIVPEVEPQAGLKVLDYRQERNARSIGDGHRVIYGVAGSGKTVLLISRAKMLSEDPEKRVLVLCFNKVLARYLKATLLGHDNVDVLHFHGWGRRNGTDFRVDEGDEEYGARLLRTLEQSLDARRFDAVLVDEAQDFACSWFHCAKAAMKEPDDGDLIIVGDGSQSLYRKRPFTWKDAGVHALGRTINTKFDLDRNYRNTAEILAAAHSFAGQMTPDGEDVALRQMRVGPQIALRHGPWPKIISAESREKEVDIVVGLVSEWISGKDGTAPINPNHIGILYPRLRRSDRSWMESLRARLSAFGVVPLAGADATDDLSTHGIKISTIHSAKGLQFRAVILMWADLLPSQLDNRDEDSERRLVYVATTRAEDLFAVTHSGPSAYVEEIRRNIEAANHSL
jgi:UvrD-like helicase C-terminal domain/Nuclease-related domain/AAA domain